MDKMELKIGKRDTHIWFSYKENDVAKQGGWLFNQSFKNKNTILEEIVKIIKQNEAVKLL